jgi:hypothetical protein
MDGVDHLLQSFAAARTARRGGAARDEGVGRGPRGYGQARAAGRRVRHAVSSGVGDAGSPEAGCAAVPRGAAHPADAADAANAGARAPLRSAEGDRGAARARH